MAQSYPRCFSVDTHLGLRTLTLDCSLPLILAVSCLSLLSSHPFLSLNSYSLFQGSFFFFFPIWRMWSLGSSRDASFWLLEHNLGDLFSSRSKLKDLWEELWPGLDYMPSTRLTPSKVNVNYDLPDPCHFPASWSCIWQATEVTQG